MTKLQLVHLPHRKAKAWGIIGRLVFYEVVLLSAHGLYSRTPILLLWESIFRLLLVAGYLWLYHSCLISLSL